jgi:hypothetical protein
MCGQEPNPLIPPRASVALISRLRNLIKKFNFSIRDSLQLRKVPSQSSPWWESNVLWGGAAIVFTVIAAMKKDLRWMLILAWPCFTMTLWKMTSILAVKRSRKILTGIGTVFIAAGLYGLNAWLRPPQIIGSGKQPNPFVHLEPLPDQDTQYQLVNLSPEEKAELERLDARLYRAKAMLLEMPEHYERKVARDKFRAWLDKIERRHGCLVDTVKVQCFPKPPATITKNEVDIDISVKTVADDPSSKPVFWVIRNESAKVRVPIVLFISLTNRQTTPVRIDLLYLDAKSVHGWADIRMVDSLFSDGRTMSESPLIMEAKNGCASMKGEYLLPSLYDRITQPGNKVEGWIIAEYPKGFKYGSSIGDMRISLLAGKHWIASKTFPASPGFYNNEDHPFEFYWTPLDTLITEEW